MSINQLTFAAIVSSAPAAPTADMPVYSISIDFSPSAIASAATVSWISSLKSSYISFCCLSLSKSTIVIGCNLFSCPTRYRAWSTLTSTGAPSSVIAKLFDFKRTVWPSVSLKCCGDLSRRIVLIRVFSRFTEDMASESERAGECSGGGRSGDGD